MPLNQQVSLGLLKSQQINRAGPFARKSEMGKLYQRINAICGKNINLYGAMIVQAFSLEMFQPKPPKEQP